MTNKKKSPKMTTMLSLSRFLTSQTIRKYTKKQMREDRRAAKVVAAHQHEHMHDENCQHEESAK